MVEVTLDRTLQVQAKRRLKVYNCSSQVHTSFQFCFGHPPKHSQHLYQNAGIIAFIVAIVFFRVNVDMFISVFKLHLDKRNNEKKQ